MKSIYLPMVVSVVIGLLVGCASTGTGSTPTAGVVGDPYSTANFDNGYYPLGYSHESYWDERAQADFSHGELAGGHGGGGRR